MANIPELVLKIKADRLIYNLDIPAPIKDAYIGAFRETFKSGFSITIDEQFIDILKICDGLLENGYKIYSSNDQLVGKSECGIFQLNKGWHASPDKKKFIFFAEGDQDLNTYDTESLKYQLHDRYSFDIFKTFQTMNDMLEHILGEMIGSEEEKDDDEANDEK